MMLQCKTIYPSKTLLSFSDRSIYYLMMEKNVVAMAKFQSVRGAFHHLTFMDNCQKFCVTSCVSPTVPVNDLAFFVFCCVRGVGFVAVAGLLSLKKTSHYLT